MVFLVDMHHVFNLYRLTAIRNRIICTMRPKTPADRLYIRPSPDALHAMKTLLVALQAPQLHGPDLTQEDFVASTWLWMAGMSPDEVAKGIGPHLKAVQAWRARTRQARQGPSGEGGTVAAGGVDPTPGGAD